MSVPLNIYIIATKTLPYRLIWICAILWGVVNVMTAQDECVAPIRNSQLYITQTEVYGYISGGLSGNANLWTANNYLYGKDKDKDINSSFVELGTAIALYNTKHEWLHFNGSIGYKYQVYSYKKLIATNEGVYTHWLDADANVSFHFSIFGLLAGAKSDILLNSTIKNSNHFSYEGIYEDCFNRASFCLYGGLLFQWSRLRLETRLGGYPVTHLNPQKISYYNITKTHVSAFYFEVKACCRLFNTGKEKRTYNLWRK